MPDLSYSVVPVAGTPQNAADVTTPLNEIKSFVNGAGWVDEDRIGDAEVTQAKSALPVVALSATTGLPSLTGSWQSVPFTSEVTDTDGLHNNSSNTSRITVATTGKYLVSWAFQAYGYASDTVLYAALFVNGAEHNIVSSRFPTASARSIAVHGTQILALSASDYIEVKAAYGGTAPTSLASERGQINLMGIRA